MEYVNIYHVQQDTSNTYESATPYWGAHTNASVTPQSRGGNASVTLYWGANKLVTPQPWGANDSVTPQ